MATLLAGIGSGLSTGIATTGGVGNILGSLVGSGLSPDVKASGLSLPTSSLNPVSGNQTGAAAFQQQAQAPQTLSANNSNQYSQPSYSQQFGTGGQSNFSTLLNHLLGS